MQVHLIALKRAVARALGQEAEDRSGKIKELGSASSTSAGV